LTIRSDSGNDHSVNEWERLGDELIRARIRKGWVKRVDMQRALNLTHDRNLSDLENAKRTNFDRATLVLAEGWYGLAPGSIQEILEGKPARYADVLDTDVTADEILRLPDGALDGLKALEREEVRASAIEAALRKAREIRHTCLPVSVGQ